MMIRPVMRETQFRSQSSVWLSMLRVFGVLTVFAGLLGGCVSSEKYEAEKARALNFQRLLAQEEKRTGEVNVKYQEVQRELSTLESQNRDLAAELDAMREQFTSTQEELTRLRDSKIDDVKSDDLTLAEPSISEFGLEDIEFKDSDFADIGSELGEEPSTSSFAGGSSSSHTVSKGETLYRISKQYGITVQDLKNWNNLSSNTITPGQKLIVSRP